jgi:hypothetical protein
MSDRTGFNKGAVLIDALRGEVLDYALDVSGASANFSVVDDLRQTVIDASNFPAGQNQVGWRLKCEPVGAKFVRVTATDQHGNQLGAYQRNISVAAADVQPLPVYTIAMLFVTAVGYKLKVGHIKQNGVVEQIVDVQYKNGKPTDHDAVEPIGIDFA